MPDTPCYQSITVKMISVTEFRCGACFGYWSAANADTDRAYHCPWCGILLYPPAPDDEAA